MSGPRRFPLQFKLTLPCGERHHPRMEIEGPMDLNSRSPVGSDGGKNMAFIISKNLNSRSPVGSDDSFMASFMIMLLFKLTLPCGERRGAGFVQMLNMQFKLTLPCGERPGPPGQRPLPADDLNSRSPVGSDNEALRTLPCRNI